MKQQESNGFAIASLVCGILSCIIPYISTILGICAIVFYTKQKDNGMAKAGLVTGIIGTIFSLIMWVIVLVLAASMM